MIHDRPTAHTVAIVKIVTSSGFKVLAKCECGWETSDGGVNYAPRETFVSGPLMRSERHVLDSSPDLVRVSDWVEQEEGLL